ncbi:centromere protein U isoform X2 [Sciurus carolinensis]|uniref:centromere protein U isoform X2 n=1 Tax=Sciurus carolinensis TaxID=30640 RepID=UPI001FB1DA90|nr:centromere protein U isoform X2 [Sciurus carolinensis]
MALQWRVRSPAQPGAGYSKNTLGRTHPMKDKADHKHRPADIFDFPDNSDISSIGSLGENEKDEEPYETFDPPLHSTAIYADEAEFSKHCGSSVPSTPQGKEGKKSSNTSENEASETESVKNSVKKPRRPKPISESESSEEDDVRRKVKSAERVSIQPHAPVPTVASSGHAEKPAESVPQGPGSLRDQAAVEKESHATQSQPKTQKKGKISPGKRKKSRREATGTKYSDISESMHIWCLEGRKTSDIMELDIVLSTFEKTLVEYRQRVESKICKEAINKFYFNIKEELIRMLKEDQMLKNLKRKNAKMTSDTDRKRQRLIEVQDELLRLEPQLTQLQTKYDELKERKSSLRNTVYFLSNLKQLYHDYSVVQEKEPNIKETYDSSSLPALLFKARTLLGAENHLQNINHQLGKLLGQE